MTILVAAIEISFGVSYFSLLIYATVGIIVLVNKNEIGHTVFASLTSLSILYCAVSILGVPILYFAASWHGSTGFNVIFGGMLVALASSVCVYSRNKPFKKPAQKSSIMIILLEFVVLLFYSFVLPRYVLDANFEKQKVSELLFFFLLFSLLVGAAFYLLNKAEKQNLKMELEAQHMKDLFVQNEQQVEHSQATEHFYRKLYVITKDFIDVGDLAGAQNFLNEYITPTIVSRKFDDQIDKVDSKLIRGLLRNALSIVAALPDVECHVMILRQTRIPKEQEFNLFKILTEYINNATHELQNQKKGVFVFRMIQTDERELLLFVGNSVQDEIKPIHKRLSEKSAVNRGYGLKMISRILQSMPMQSHTTRIGIDETTGECLFYQRILFSWD